MALADDAREEHTRRVAREDAEGLRRRLYAPGASSADLERYRGTGPARHLPVAVADPARLPPPVRRRTSALVVPLVVAVLVVGAFVVARGAGRSATASIVPVVAAPTGLTISPDDRQAVRDALASRDDAAVASFLVSHRAPPALLTASRSLLVEQTGTGTATVGVDPESAAAFRGRATVLLVLGRSSDAGWTTFRRTVDASGARTLEPQRERRGPQAAGGLTTDTYRYGSGAQPVEVRVGAPKGVRWAVEVVFTD